MLAHVLGLEDLDPLTHPHKIMAATLASGVRRMPTAADINLLFANET